MLYNAYCAGTPVVLTAGQQDRRLLLGGLPRRLRDALADGFGYLTYRFNAKRARYASVNLAWCFPELSETQRQRLARRHFQAQAGAMFDIPLFRFAGASRLKRFVTV